MTQLAQKIDKAAAVAESSVKACRKALGELAALGFEGLATNARADSPAQLAFSEQDSAVAEDIARRLREMTQTCRDMDILLTGARGAVESLMQRPRLIEDGVTQIRVRSSKKRKKGNE